MLPIARCVLPGGRVLAFVVIGGLCAPAITGALDLYLRARTP